MDSMGEHLNVSLVVNFKKKSYAVPYLCYATPQLTYATPQFGYGTHILDKPHTILATSQPEKFSNSSYTTEQVISHILLQLTTKLCKHIIQSNIY
jgi:hypothetical protein